MDFDFDNLLEQTCRKHGTEFIAELMMKHPEKSFLEIKKMLETIPTDQLFPDLL